MMARDEGLNTSEQLKCCLGAGLCVMAKWVWRCCIYRAFSRAIERQHHVETQASLWAVQLQHRMRR